METPRVNSVIVIGEACADEVCAVSHVIERQGLVPRICRTIYAAAAELGQAQAQVVLMVGPAHVMARENASLVRLAEETCVTCCCLVGSPVSLSDALIKGIGQGSVVLCHTRNFSIWLEQYLGLSRGSASHRVPNQDAMISEPLVSNAEQAALLGGYGDA